MHGRPHFLFSSGIQCSVCFALLESSMRCTWPTQRSSFLYCGLQHVLSCCFPCNGIIIKYTFNILLRQDAVISFNCRSVTITCCHSTATCAPVFSLTSHCWNSRFISLHQLTGEIPENSGTKVTRSRRRQSYCVKSSVSHIFTSQSHFFTWLTPGTSRWSLQCIERIGCPVQC